MKKKNLYVLIVIAVIAIICLILWLLNTSKKEINPEHIRLNFIIHNQTPLSDKDDFIKNDFLKPLLASTVIGNVNGIENLFIAGIQAKDNKFCVPAQGMNYLRYDVKSPLNQTNYTSTAREADELSFFESWKGGEKLEKIIKSLKSDNLKLKLPPISVILNQQKYKFVDSLIICAKCSDQEIKTHEPFVFKSATELRKFVNQQLEKYPNALDEKGINNSIKIFIYKDLLGINSPSPNPDIKKDTDGDGVPDNIDGCPEEKGSKELKGCPDDDGDKVPNNLDQCKEPGDPKCSGCPCRIVPCPSGDKDLDGVCDDKDNCPNDFGQIQFGGCPPDSDRDGIWDKFDKCPFEKGLKKFQGCPDTDGDNVPDYQDKCPREFGEINCNGCKCNDNNDISISLSGSKFQITGVTIGVEYTAKLVAQGQFKTKEFSFNGAFCPSNTSESKSMSKQIDTDDLTVTIVVFKNGKEIDRKSFSGLSYVCFSNNDCGFLKD